MTRADRDEVGQAWLDSTDAESTLRTYRLTLSDWFGWCDRNGVDALRPGRHGIDRYRRAAARKGNQRTTIARKLSTLSSFYTYVVEERPGWELDNPVSRVRRPKLAKESNRTSLDPGEIRAVLARAAEAGGRDEAVMALLMWTGMRVAELRGCRVTDLGRERGERVVTVTRKGGKRQTVVLVAQAWVPLAAYLDGREDGPLIVGRRGGPISWWEVARTVERVVPEEVRKEKGVTPHSLRHTFTTLALDAGADPRRVREMLGHSSMDTTMGYDHLRKRVDLSPAHDLARLLKER